MDYVLVQNKQTVLMGPIPWIQPRFQREINDLVDNGEKPTRYQIPTKAPEENDGYLDLGEGFEMFPVELANPPNFDPIYFQLAGPYYAYVNNYAVQSWDAVPVELWQSKNTMIEKIKALRYSKENGGITLDIQGLPVRIDTDRARRSIFTEKLTAMSETDTINWKFNEGWLTLSYSDVQTIVTSIANHVQQQFDWELQLTQQVDAVQTVEELQSIDIDGISSI